MEKEMLESIPHPAMLINKDRIVKTVNSKADHTGITVGKYCWDTFGHKVAIPEKDRKLFEEKGKVPKNGTQCVFCMADKALRSQTEQVTDLIIKGIILETHWIPVSDTTYIHYAFQK